MKRKGKSMVGGYSKHGGTVKTKTASRSKVKTTKRPSRKKK